MVRMNDNTGRACECRLLSLSASPQPLTKEIFWQVIAIGYDGIRRAVLYSFPNKEQAIEKLIELYPEYSEKINQEYPDYK